MRSGRKERRKEERVGSDESESQTPSFTNTPLPPLVLKRPFRKSSHPTETLFMKGTLRL